MIDPALQEYRSWKIAKLRELNEAGRENTFRITWVSPIARTCKAKAIEEVQQAIDRGDAAQLSVWASDVRTALFDGNEATHSTLTGPQKWYKEFSVSTRWRGAATAMLIDAASTGFDMQDNQATQRQRSGRYCCIIHAQSVQSGRRCRASSACHEQLCRQQRCDRASELCTRKLESATESESGSARYGLTVTEQRRIVTVHLHEAV